MKFFVVFAAFVCIAYANTVKEKAVEEDKVEDKAFKALKAIEDPLFSKNTTEYNQETDNEKKTKIVDDFVQKVVGLETADQNELRNLIKANSGALIDILTDAKKVTTANDLKTKMNANVDLKKALELIVEAKEAVEAFNALKAMAEPLFSKTKAEYDQETDTKKRTKIVDDFVQKVVGLDSADQDELKNLIKANPTLIDNLTDAKKVTTAKDLKTQMDANANLKKALELIAKSELAANSASAIGMSGLMVVSVVSLFLLH